MPIEALQLLRRLEPAVRPGYSPATRGPGGPGRAPGLAAFESALSLMSGGTPSGRRPLMVSAGASMAEALEGDELERLAVAADAAEAAGAERAAMILGGRVFIIEVPGRILQTELLEEGTASHFQLDAALLVPGDGPATMRTTPRGIGPPSPVLTPAVARHLLALDDRPSGSPPTAA
ncbi:MAG: hypothetical protein HKO59_17600 [Phycisphaerales bacterium]|nr:hypothetical protein [Phycisphaerae bacterium]NNM27758.1 hypothetical protein [Phycisphaerales bacterium]